MPVMPRTAILRYAVRSIARLKSPLFWPIPKPWPRHARDGVSAQGGRNVGHRLVEGDVGAATLEDFEEVFSQALADLLRRAEMDVEFYNALRDWCAGLRQLFEPALERQSWQDLLSELFTVYRIGTACFLDVVPATLIASCGVVCATAKHSLRAAMPLSVVCSQCGKTLRAPDEMAGKRFVLPRRHSRARPNSGGTATLHSLRVSFPHAGSKEEAIDQDCQKSIRNRQAPNRRECKPFAVGGGDGHFRHSRVELREACMWQDPCDGPRFPNHGNP
jgi:hypothetical protein